MIKKKSQLSVSATSEQKADVFQPYDQTHQVLPMRLMVIIVKHHYDKEIVEILHRHEVSLIFITHGRGTVTKELYDVLGLGDVRKDIVFGVVKTAKMEAVKKDIADFYRKEKHAKGIAFAIDISSVIGLSIYKYLSNTRTIGE